MSATKYEVFVTKWLPLVLAAAACGGSGDAPAARPTHDDGSVLDDAETPDRGAVMNAPDASGDGDPGAIHPDAQGNSGGSGGDAVSRDNDGAAPDRGSPMRPDGTAGDGGPSGPLTIEALQVAGTHNSYHKAPAIAFDASHKYTHLPLDQQLAGGVRGLELDLHLRTDGVFDVYHLSLIDPNSTCNTLEDCLGVVAGWSSAHASHTPIFIW